MGFGGLWGGPLWASGLWGGLPTPVLVPAIVGGAGGGLDAWDRAFSRELEALWVRPKHKKLVKLKKREDDEEAVAVLRMLGFLP